MEATASWTRDGVEWLSIVRGRLVSSADDDADATLQSPEWSLLTVRARDAFVSPRNSHRVYHLDLIDGRATHIGHQLESIGMSAEALYADRSGSDSVFVLGRAPTIDPASGEALAPYTTILVEVDAAAQLLHELRGVGEHAPIGVLPGVDGVSACLSSGAIVDARSGVEQLASPRSGGSAFVACGGDRGTPWLVGEDGAVLHHVASGWNELAWRPRSGTLDIRYGAAVAFRGARAALADGHDIVTCDLDGCAVAARVDARVESLALCEDYIIAVLATGEARTIGREGESDSDIVAGVRAAACSDRPILLLEGGRLVDGG